MPSLTDKEKAGRDAALAKVLSDLDKQFGKGTVMRLTDGGVQDIEMVSTGSLNLDIALGGGIPRGKIVEVFGAESAGKTTLIYHIIAEFQRLGGVCAFIDAEHAMDPIYAKAVGVDPDALLVSQPDYGEQALEIADQLARSGAVDLICVDSVAALTPRAELEGQMGDTTVGLQARMMGQAMRKLAGNLSRTNTACVFTNQVREKVGVQYGSPETQPGGKALKFFSSQRMKIAKNGQPHKGKDEFGKEIVIGNPTRVDVVKNKVAPPFKRAEFDIMFGTGIAYEGEILDRGVDFGFITKSGSFYSYGETRLGQGRTNAMEFLKENVGIRDAIAEQVKAKLGMGVVDAEVSPVADFVPEADDQDDDATLAVELGVTDPDLEPVA